MGLVEEVQNLCQSADDSTLRSKAHEWTGNTEPACKEVISTIKKIIKTRKALPIVRLRALKLHHHCMFTNNVNYLNFAVKKILSRLTILAQHRRSLGTMGRGEDIFGAISLKSEENKQASADFLVCLLRYIQAWAARFGRYGDGRNTPYLEAYIKLTSMGVTFPSPEQQPRPSLQDLSSSDQESCRTSSELLSELLASPEVDPDLLTQLSATLTAFLPRIQQAGLRDVVTTTLSRYEAWKARASLPAPVPSSPRGRLVRSSTESVLPSKAKLERIWELEKELASLQRQANDLQSRTTQQRKDAQQAQEEGKSEISAQIALQNEEIEDRKAKSAGRSELSRAELRLQSLVTELQTWEQCIKEKDRVLPGLRMEVEREEEENGRLKSILQGEKGVFSTQIGMIRSESENNTNLWPLILNSDAGLLYSDLEVEIRYDIQSGNSFSIQILNKMPTQLQGLSTKVIDCASEGLILAVNRENEGIPVAIGGQTTRFLSPSLRNCYTTLPRLVVTYLPSRSIECFLPLHFLRFLTPGIAQDVREVWASLASESDSKSLVLAEGSPPWFRRFFSTSPSSPLLSASFQGQPVLLEPTPGQVQCRAKGSQLRLAVLTSVRLRTP